MVDYFFPTQYYILYNSLYVLFSACTSASLEPSYVLRAIGADEDIAHSSIRLVHVLLIVTNHHYYYHLLKTISTIGEHILQTVEVNRHFSNKSTASYGSGIGQK